MLINYVFLHDCANVAYSLMFIKIVQIQLKLYFISDSYLIEEGGTILYFAKSKFMSVLSKNRGYFKLVIINRIISGEISKCDEDHKLSIEDLS